MKIARFRWGDSALYGVVEGDVVYSLQGDLFGSPIRGAEKCRLADVKLLAPIVPPKVIGIGPNFGHRTEVPSIFFKPPTAVVGPDDAIVLPRQSPGVAFEGEMAVIVSKPGKDIPEDKVGEHILGYTCGNDLTGRDAQKQDGHRSRAKSFDTFCPLGPFLVTGLDHANLRIQTRVNGETRQDGNTRDMVFTVERVVSFCSGIVSLEAGDVILMGTPPGHGLVSDGDVVEVEVEGIGVLRNPVKVQV